MSSTEINPLDITALEKAVNESAVRVSTIWGSYLLFGVYLGIAVGNVTLRQLFLSASFKLPVLNVDLSLFAFFFLAPLLFTVFHMYLLLQVLLYRVPEIVTRGRFPDGGESDSAWRTQEARHVGSDTIAPGF